MMRKLNHVSVYKTEERIKRILKTDSPGNVVLNKIENSNVPFFAIFSIGNNVYVIQRFIKRKSPSCPLLIMTVSYKKMLYKHFDIWNDFKIDGHLVNEKILADLLFYKIGLEQFFKDCR